MADIAGLFGITPQMYEQQQRQAALNEGVSMAKLAPEDRAQAMIYSAGAGLGRAGGGLLGAEDPQMQLISNRNQVMQQLNLNDPTSLAKGVEIFNRTGDVQAAQALAAQVQAMMKAQAETQKIGAEATKIGLENVSKQGAVQQLISQFGMDQTQALAVASNADLLKSYLTPKTQQGFKLLETGKYTPESINSWVNGGELEIIDKTAKPPADWLGKARELGLPVAATFGSYTPEQVAAVNKAVFNEEIAKKAAGAAVTRVSISQKGDEAFVTELGKLDAKKVSDAFTTRENATSAINSLNKLAQLPDNELISGQFATGRVGATNLLTSLGLASETDAKKLSTSQQYQKVAGDVILQTLGGKLGSGFSNADREFIANLVPQLETNPDARRKLISFMQNKNQDIVKESIRLENYARQNKGLSGFEPKIPMSVAPSQPRPYSGLSDAELEAKIRAAQAQQR
jgi:hypothetical protein